MGRIEPRGLARGLQHDGKPDPLSKRPRTSRQFFELHLSMRLDVPASVHSLLIRPDLVGEIGWDTTSTPENYTRVATNGTAQASPPLNRRERVRNRFSRPLSRENMPPLPGTTSMISWVCLQASNWLPLI